MAQNSKCGSQPDLICVASSTFQSSCKYIDVTYTPILQPLNLIDGAGGGERHSEVRKSQDLSLTGASSVMSVSPAPITRLDWMKACGQTGCAYLTSFMFTIIACFSDSLVTELILEHFVHGFPGPKGNSPLQDIHKVVLWEANTMARMWLGGRFLAS